MFLICFRESKRGWKREAQIYIYNKIFAFASKPINPSSGPQGLLVYVAVSSVSKSRKEPWKRSWLGGTSFRGCPAVATPEWAGCSQPGSRSSSPRAPPTPIPSPGEAERSPAPVSWRLQDSPNSWSPSGPQAPRGSRATPAARSSNPREREEVALGDGGGRSGSHLDAGVQPRWKAEMAAAPKRGHLRSSRSAGVVSAVGRLQTPRRRCQATLRRGEKGSRVGGEEELGGSAWDGQKAERARWPLRDSLGAAEGTPSCTRGRTVTEGGGREH